MTKHTPGPWNYDMEGCPTSHGLPIIEKGNGHLLASMADRNEANARLIAAAPELLEALERITDSHARLEQERGSVVGTLTANARAAIAKATGDK